MQLLCFWGTQFSTHSEFSCFTPIGVDAPLISSTEEGSSGVHAPVRGEAPRSVVSKLQHIGGRGPNRTWYGVVEDEADDSADERVGSEQHNEQVVELRDSCVAETETDTQK